MLKLCGFSSSNYYNKAKLALLEKGVAFTEELIYPSSDPTLLRVSPMGKLPYIDTGHGLLRESQVIDEYFEDMYPEPPLYPRDPMARARCREMIQFIELYIELPARRLYSSVFFGAPASSELNQEVSKALDKGMRAIAALVRFEPYIAGSEFSLADIAAAVHFPLAANAVKLALARDLLEPIPAIKPYLKMLSERPHFQTVGAARKADVEALAARRAKS